MANPAQGGPPSQFTSTTTCSPPEQGTPTDKPSRSPSGSPNAPTSPLGRISYLQQRYQTEGLSTQVASLLIAAPHAKHMNQAGGAGAAGVLQGKLILFQHL